MKAKMSYKSKKIAIITAIILVLIGGISVGTYFYIKGNAETKATTGDNTTITNETIADQNTVSEEQNQENNEINNSSNTETSNTNTGSNNGSINNSNTNNNNLNSSSSKENSDEELPNEEYTQTDLVETGNQILVSEALAVGWINADLSKDNVSTKIDVVKPTLELNKTAEINSINSEDNAVQKGSKITYNITVTNTSKEVDATNVTITDKVPTGTILDSDTAISDNGKEENGKITWNIDVPANSSKTVSFTVVVTAEDGEIKNIAVVDGKETPETVNPVIESNKTYSSEDDIIRNGSIITYTIAVTNKSDINAITSVKDTVPEGTTLEEVVTEGSSVDENVINWNDVTLVAGETKTFTFNVKVNNFDGENRIIRNIAVVGNKETPETETEVHYPVISSVKNADKGSVEAGEKLTYTITITNSGIVDGNVKVTDSAPEGTTFDKNTNVTVSNDEKTYSEEDLNKGIDVKVPAKVGEADGKVTVSFTVIVDEDAKGSILNKAIVDDGTPTDEENPSVEIPVITTNKEVNAETAKAGETFTYTITVINTGDANGKATIADTIPKGTTFVANSIKVNGESTEYKAEDLAKGIEVDVEANGKTTVTFDVTVGDLNNGYKIRNVATVNGKETPGTETEYQEPVITSSKTSNKSAVAVGEEIEYTITAYNNGYADGKATIKDTIPEGTSFVEGSIVVDGVAKPELTATDLTNGIEVDVEAATRGEESITAGKATVTFKVVVEEGAEGSIINQATVNDTPTEEIKNPVISARKTATANGITSTNETEVEQGDTITYTITVSNTGDVAGKATVADMIPTGTTFVANSIKVNGESQEYTSKQLANGIEVDVEANGKTTVSFDVTVGDLNNGDKIRNVATVNGKETPETETEYQEPVITLSKKSNKTAVVAGETITYTITATNTGSAEGKVVVKDTVPANTTVADEGNVIVSDANSTRTLKIKDLNDGIELTVPAKVENANGTATVTFKVTVNNGATGTISNTAYVDDTPIKEVKNPVITANKTATIDGKNATTAKVGDIITYTITLTNTGTQTGTVIVKDNAPIGTEFVSDSIVINGESRKDLTLENLINGIPIAVTTTMETTLSFKVQVQDIQNNDLIKNVAYINDEPSNETTTTYQEPVISVEKTADKKAVVAGETITYTITATNTGSAEGKVVVKDTVPTNTTIADEGKVIVTDANSNGKIFTKEQLEKGIELTVPAKVKNTNGTATVTFKVTVNNGATGTISNKAYVDNTPTDKVDTPIISVIKKVNKQKAEVGDTITYTIELTNNSNITDTFKVQDTIPSNTTFVDGSIEINGIKDSTKNLDDLTNGFDVEIKANGKTTVSFDVTVKEGTAAGTEIKNIANVNDVPTNETTTTVVEPTLTITKTAKTVLEQGVAGQKEDEAEVGDIIVYTITVENSSEVKAENVTVEDMLPTELTYIDKSMTTKNSSTKAVYNSESRTISYNGSVDRNTTLTIQFKARVNEKAELKEGNVKEISNTATLKVNGKEKGDATAETDLVKKVTVSTTAETINSLDVVLVLDTSGSMNYDMSKRGETRLDNLKDAAKQLVSRLFSTETDSSLTIINYSESATANPKKYTYSENIIETLNGREPTGWGDRGKEGVIDKLNANGGTNFYAALSKANEVVNDLAREDTANNRQRLVVFLTDGSPTFYYTNSGEYNATMGASNLGREGYENNLRPQIIDQAKKLKNNANVVAVSIGTSGLSDNKVQYVEKVNKNDPNQAEIFNNKKVTLSCREFSRYRYDGYPIFEGKTTNVDYYYMYEKEYAEYILNNIASSGEYIESSDLINTFDNLLSDYTTNKWSYSKNKLPLEILIPEERKIIDNEVTVQIGDNAETLNLNQLTNGNNYQGLIYESTQEFTGFKWKIDENNESLFNNDLAISVKVKGVAEDNQ